MRIAVHFRYGEFGHVCRGKRASQNGSACAQFWEVKQFYNSNMDAILRILRQLEAPLGGLAARADLHLFSTGKPHAGPFAAFRRAYPAATLHVVDEGQDAVSGSALPDPLVPTVFTMADADVLITSCGVFSYLMGALNMGVKFRARGCMEPPALWTSGTVDYDLETGDFPLAAFEGAWRRYSDDRPSRSR